ncbi:MAG TPA: hypothetical protein DEB35_02990 [Desulfuromonas sp.]|nr:hypothetical protein [Desulfuromonas sp.]
MRLLLSGITFGHSGGTGRGHRHDTRGAEFGQLLQDQFEALLFGERLIDRQGDGTLQRSQQALEGHRRAAGGGECGQARAPAEGLRVNQCHHRAGTHLPTEEGRGGLRAEAHFLFG